MKPEWMKSDEERRRTYVRLFRSGLCACASHGYLDQVHGGRDREQSPCLYRHPAMPCPVGVGTGLMGEFMDIKNVSHVFGSIRNLTVLVHVRTNYLRHALRHSDPEKVVKAALTYERIAEEHMRWGLRIAAELPDAKLLLSTYEDMELNMTTMVHNLWNIIGFREPERKQLVTMPRRNKNRPVTPNILAAIQRHGGAQAPCLYELAS